MLPDAVITIIPNGKLSALLSAIHSDGMGYLARIATVERGPLLDQLQRAGIPVSQAPAAVADRRTSTVHRQLADAAWSPASLDRERARRLGRR
jgi:hypothetical protein